MGAVPFLLPVFACSLFSYIPWLAISGGRVQSSAVQRFKVPHKRKAESGLCHSKFDVQSSMFNVPHSPVSAFQYFSLSAFPRRPPFKVQGSRFKVQRFSRSTRPWIDRNVRCPIPILKGLDPSARGCSRRATPGGRWIGASTLNGLLKKLESMIQLNSQETTETTELYPVTTFEQGRRED